MRTGSLASGAAARQTHVRRRRAPRVLPVQLVVLSRPATAGGAIMEASRGLRADAPSWSGGASASGSGASGAAAASVVWAQLPRPAQRLPGALVPFLPQDNNEASAAAAEARPPARA